MELDPEIVAGDSDLELAAHGDALGPAVCLAGPLKVVVLLVPPLGGLLPSAEWAEEPQSIT